MKNKPLAMLFSIVVAFTLWLYVITVVSPESTSDIYNVPVVFEGENILTDKGLMLISDEIPTVKLTLSGYRSDLVNINAGNVTVIADLAKITEPGTHALSYTVTPPGDVSTVTVQDRDPRTITVTVVERLSAKIPVRVNYTGTLPEGFIMDKENALLDYTEVNVTGPKDVVEQIDHAAIEINCDGRTETIVESQRFVLCDAQGNPLDVSLVTADVEEIRLEVKVSRVKAIPLVLTVNSGGGATEENSSIVLDPWEINISGSDTALENLNELNLGTINLAEITDDTQKEYDIILPEGIKNESGVTKAKLSISFPELSKKDFTITDIKTENVTEGMEAQLLTKQLVITVRGPKAQVNSLRVEDISVVLDLTDVVNSDTMVPSITFGEDYPDVGVVGKPTVSVTVAVPETTAEATTEE